MLQSITIRNYALIQHLEIDFNQGLNTITGETGAGKSILLGALSLLLGNRADTSVLKDQSTKCVVEASFHIGGKNIEQFFKENDLDYETETVIRREINDKGKSRAFVNDSPVNLAVLKELGGNLVDIHSQHETLLLGNDEFQLNVIDAFAQANGELTAYNTLYNEYKNIVSDYNSLKKMSDQSKSDLDYLQFQFEQLSKANLVEGEQAELEDELEMLTHSEDIKLNLSKADFIFNNEESSALASLKEAVQALQNVEGFYEEIKSLSERLNSTYLELSDISQEIDNLNDKIEHDPARIDFIRSRLDAIYSLQQKHNVASVEKLIEIRDDLDNKILNIENFDSRIEEFEKQISIKESELEKLANTISEIRKNTSLSLSEEIVEILSQLGIANAAFDVEIEEAPEFLPTGKDILAFKFSANRNMPLMELSKVASGGEMSRVMLSLKSVLAKTTSLPTIIFDEIDTGTSGEIADKMGTIIKGMAANLQVINITHLPQIASKGDYHYLVYKNDLIDTTYTNIRLLSQEERIEEIAKMLSGEELSEAAYQNARNLLERN